MLEKIEITASVALALWLVLFILWLRRYIFRQSRNIGYQERKQMAILSPVKIPFRTSNVEMKKDEVADSKLEILKDCLSSSCRTRQFPNSPPQYCANFFHSLKYFVVSFFIKNYQQTANVICFLVCLHTVATNIQNWMFILRLPIMSFLTFFDI